MATPKHGYSKEQLGSLTEEELKGLEDDSFVDEGADEVDDEEDTAAADAAAAAAAEAAKQPTADEQAAAAAAAAAAAPKPTPEKPAAGDDAAKKAAEDAAKAAAEAAAKPADEGKQSTATSAFPSYQAPADAKAQLDGIKQRRADLAKQFDEGEITAAEMRAKDTELEEQRDALKEQLLKATLSSDHTMATWSKQTVPAFLANHAQYEAGSTNYHALDAEVRRLQAASDNPFDPTLLEKAHTNLQAAARRQLGLKDDDPALKPTDPKTPPKPGGKREIPPTLANVPASDVTDDGDGGEFAYLDRLSATDTAAFEKAMAKLSDAKRDEYLAQ